MFTKIRNIAAAVLLIMTVPAQAAEFYLDFGIGWLHELPAEGEAKANGVVFLEQEVRVNIESPFLDLALGLEFEKSWYGEVRRFGIIDNPEKSITIVKIGKRFYF